MKKRFTFVLTVLALVACVFTPMGMMGQEKANAATYKLVQVTSVSAGNKYVFVQSSHAMSNSIVSSALQTTTSYNTTGLSGTESYVWSLESANGGYYMKNVSLSSSQYLNNASSTNVSFGSKTSIWTFSFSNNVATIKNKSNSNRYLGFTTSTSYAYKAYSESGHSSSITVYQLVEIVPECSVSPTNWDFGEVPVNTTSTTKTFAVTSANLTGSLSVSVNNSVFSAAFNANQTSITVNCTPTGIGTTTGTMTISGGGLANPVTVSLSVTGFSTDPACNINEDMYDFGNVFINTSKQATFTITTANLTEDLTLSIDNAAYSLSTSTINHSANTTSLVVTFTPNATATYEANLTFSGNGFEDELLAIYSGTGISANTVAFNINGSTCMTAAVSANSIDLNQFSASDENFVGWCTNPQNISVLSSPYNLGSSNLYAVFFNGYIYKKVTNVNELAVGDYVVIAANDNNYAMSTTQNANNREETSITKNSSNNTITWTSTSNVCVFQLKAGSKSNTYAFYDSEYPGYIYAASSTKNYLKTQSSIDANASWTITISSTGVASVVANGTYSNKTMRHNNTSSLFSCYGSSSSCDPICLYKRVPSYSTAVSASPIIANIPTNISVTVKAGHAATLSGTNNGTAANLVIEEGGQLIHSNNGVQATLQKDITAYTSQKDNYYLMALPFDSYSVGGSPFVTVSGNAYVAPQNYDFFKFDGAATQEEWQIVGTEDALEAGVGFLYANNVGGTLNLTGTLVPSNESWETPLDYAITTFGKWNLIGNPFACEAQTDCESFYVIGDDNELEATSGTIAPLQGIFVQATGANQIVTFTRVEGAKSAQTLTVNVYKENASKGAAVVDRAIVRFDESQGLEKFQLNPNHTKVYFTQDNKDYAVVRSANEGEMPVNFKAAENGNYTLSVEAENVEASYLHLFDNKTGADVDLLASPSYTFQANSSDYANRFRLVFDANNEDGSSTGSEPFAFFNGSEWQISNVGEATLQVVDMMGRVLSSQTINGNANVNINQAAGIYMLRLVNGENVKVQKVVVR